MFPDENTEIQEDDRDFSKGEAQVVKGSVKPHELKRTISVHRILRDSDPGMGDTFRRMTYCPWLRVTRCLPSP